MSEPAAEATAPDPAPSTEERPAKKKPTGLIGLLKEFVIVLGTAIVLSLLIKTFLVQAFYIPSESMEDTLIKGDRVLVSQLTPGPIDLKRGDIVVFKDPGGWLMAPPPAANKGPVAEAINKTLTFIGILPQDAGEHLIKRVIGMPGDRVVCCDAEGKLTVNGAPVDEPYLANGAQPSERPFDVTVPQGRLWVLGDNRQRSRDSRWHTDLPGGGTISEDLVVGRAIVIVYPFSRWDWLSNHQDQLGKVPAPSNG